MSSAEIASTIELEFFLIEIAASIPVRIPEITTDWGAGSAPASVDTGVCCA
jgi:hypothetical protein